MYVPIPSTALTLGIVLLFRIGMGIGCVVSWQVSITAVFEWTGSRNSGVDEALRLTEGADISAILVGDDEPSGSPTVWIEGNRATAYVYLKGQLYTTPHTVTGMQQSMGVCMAMEVGILICTYEAQQAGV